MWRREFANVLRQASAPHLRRFFSHHGRPLLVLPSVAYKERVQKGEVTEDAIQIAALKHLDRLYTELEKAEQAGAAAAKPAEKKGGFFSKWISSSSAPAAKPDSPFLEIKGLYMFGGVGCGKSFLMDLFFEHVPVKKKKRAHFHRFMLDVHEKIHEIKTYRPKASGIDEVVEQLSGQIDLLCFDEFQVTDIADAMILRRLFTELFARGVVMVSTSNRAPDGLYMGGLNREAFTPFIDLLYQKCHVHDMKAEVDYRLTGEKVTNTYFYPLDDKAKDSLVATWKTLSAGEEITSTALEVFGRPIEVRICAAGMAFFTFAELCAKAMGAADFGAIAKEFHTVFLSQIPRFTPEKRNEVKRFILLIDEMYEHKVKLVVSAAAPPEQLLEERQEDKGDGHLPLGGDNADAYMLDALGKQGAASSQTLFTSQEERFAFARAVSRLQEMQTKEYMMLQHVTKGRPPYIVDV